ncbi:redoxin family protein [Streptomyces lavendulae]|uniref:redoxin family protein n=1 Tax=Streptomyces lavendulae TaxID=1914 RepID=UPI0036B546A1
MNELRSCGAAPPLAGIAKWLNTPGGSPLDLASLRGRVVLIDFWAHSCINCRRSLPHIEAWDRAYRDKGLTVIGVHSPESPSRRTPATSPTRPASSASPTPSPSTTTSTPGTTTATGSGPPSTSSTLKEPSATSPSAKDATPRPRASSATSSDKPTRRCGCPRSPAWTGTDSPQAVPRRPTSAPAASAATPAPPNSPRTRPPATPSRPPASR